MGGARVREAAVDENMSSNGYNGSERLGEARIGQTSSPWVEHRDADTQRQRAKGGGSLLACLVAARDTSLLVRGVQREREAKESRERKCE